MTTVNIQPLFICRNGQFIWFNLVWIVTTKVIQQLLMLCLTMHEALFQALEICQGTKQVKLVLVALTSQMTDDWINETGKRHLYSVSKLCYWIWVSNTSFHYDISSLLTTYINSIIRTYECSEKNFRDREEKCCVFILNSNFTQKFLLY